MRNYTIHSSVSCIRIPCVGSRVVITNSINYWGSWCWHSRWNCASAIFPSADPNPAPSRGNLEQNAPNAKFGSYIVFLRTQGFLDYPSSLLLRAFQKGTGSSGRFLHRRFLARPLTKLSHLYFLYSYFFEITLKGRRWPVSVLMLIIWGKVFGSVSYKRDVKFLSTARMQFS